MQLTGPSTPPQQHPWDAASTLPRPRLTSDELHEIETLRAAFLRHSRSRRYLARQPDLGSKVPWVLVKCECLQGTVRGIVVGGDWENVALEWWFDSHFTVFTTDGFFGVNGWLFGHEDLTVLASLPGSDA